MTAIQLQDELSNLALQPISTIKGGVMIQQTPAQFLADNPRTDGTSTVTIGGTVTDADVATITISSGMLPAGSRAFQATASSDTATTFAAKLVALINADTYLKALNVVASNVAGVITITWPGALSLTVVNSVAKTGVLTITRSGSGKYTSGAGPIIPYQTFEYLYNGQVLQFYAGVPQKVHLGLLTLLARDGVPIY